MTEKTSFSDFEKAAMKERAAELCREQEKKRSKKNPEADVLEAIAEMSDTSAQIASHLHEIMHELAPNLTPKTWYGMPAYADANKLWFILNTLRSLICVMVYFVLMTRPS